MKANKNLNILITGAHYEGQEPTVVTDKNGAGFFFISHRIPLDPEPGRTKGRYQLYKDYFHEFDFKDENLFQCIVCNETFTKSINNDRTKMLQHMKAHPHLMYWADRLRYFQSGNDNVEKLYEQAMKKRNAGDVYSKKRAREEPKAKKNALGFDVVREPPHYRRRVTEALILGDLPLSAVDNNLGIRNIIKVFNGDNIPKGLSKSSIRREVDDVYEQEINILRQQLQPHANKFRHFSIEHDLWTRASNVNSECGIGLSYIDTDKKPWELVKVPLTMMPTKASHTAKQVRDITTSVLRNVHIGWSNIFGGVADNASAAFNVVSRCSEDTDIGHQCITRYQDHEGFHRNFTCLPLGCVCHTLNLITKHSILGEYMRSSSSRSFHKDPDLKTVIAVLQAMHDIGTKFKSSEKHLSVLHVALKDLKLSVLNPKAYVETRWNSWIDVVMRWTKIEPAIALVINGRDTGARIPSTLPQLFTTGTKAEQSASMVKFKKCWDLIRSQQGLLIEILPLLTCIAQWVQVLSAKKFPTINKVLLMIDSIENETKKLWNRGEATEIGTGDVERNINKGLSLKSYSEAFRKNMEYYFKPLKEMPLLHAAAYVDPLLNQFGGNFINVETAQTFLIQLLQAKSRASTRPSAETTASSEHGNTASAPPAAGGRRRNSAAMTEPSSTQVSGPVAGSVSSRATLMLEFQTYLGACANFTDAELESMDVLTFWSNASDTFRSLQPLVSMILAMPASSANTERFFSSAKRTDTRPAMKDELLGQLVFLKETFKGKEPQAVGKSKSRGEQLVKWKLFEDRVTLAQRYEDDGCDDGLGGDDVVSSLDKPTYKGDIEDCPEKVPSSLIEHTSATPSYVSVYFDPPDNKWCLGELRKVNRRKTKTDNVEVYYAEDKRNYDFLFTKDNYGPDKLWVIPKNVVSESAERDSSEEVSSTDGE